MKLCELIEQLGGTAVKGDPERVISGVDSAAAADEHDLVFAEDAESAAEAVKSKAGAVVAKPGCVAPDVETGIAVVEDKQPRLWFARAAKLLAARPAATGVHPAAIVGARVELGEGVSVGPCAVVGDGAVLGAGTRVEAGAVVGEGVRVGRDCRIYPRVVIYPGVTLGDRVVVHAGTVLGADGFGYVRDNETGSYTQFPQQGTLAIEDDVEIGANSTIDRGALAETRIGRGTKADNLVHVGHNCTVEDDVILVAGVGIGGSSFIGRGAVLGGQAGVADHVTIASGVILGARAGVPSHKRITLEGLKPGTVFWGTPARPIAQYLRELATLAKMTKERGKKG